MNYQFSKLAARLNTESAEAWQVHDRAMAMQRAGEDVILLSIGDPDFRTPEPIIDNAVSHMRVGRTHYSPALGELNLRRAVADYETRVSPHKCTVDEVAVFPGVTAAIYAVLSCLLNPGDEVVLVDPQYVGYAPILNALDSKVSLVNTTAAHGFVPTLDDLLEKLSKDTRVVLLNTPANPSGSIITPDVLSALMQYCQEHGIWLVCDEVYSMFTFDQPHVSLRTAAVSLDYLVVIDGLSKSHAMSGWRVGWSVSPPALTEQLGRFAAMSLFGCPQFIQDASAFALNNDEYYVREMRQVYRKRRDTVCQMLATMKGIDYIKPEAGMFVMIDVSVIEPDDTLFASALLAAEKVSVLPGSAFGESTRGHVRFSLVQPVELLIKGCERLARFVENRA